MDKLALVFIYKIDKLNHVIKCIDWHDKQDEVDLWSLKRLRKIKNSSMKKRPGFV